MPPSHLNPVSALVKRSLIFVEKFVDFFEIVLKLSQVGNWTWFSKDILFYSFNKSKYFHLYCCSADIRIYLLLDNVIDRKIEVTAMQFILVQKRHQTHDWTLIGSDANGLHNHSPHTRVLKYHVINFGPKHCLHLCKNLRF